MRAVFLDYDTVSHDDLDVSRIRDALAPAGTLEIHAATADAQVAARIGDADIVLVNRVRLGAAHFAAAPALKLIALAATGTDNVDLAAAAAHGIAVCNVRAYCTASVVQHVWSLILALTQQLAASSALIARGEWRCGAERSVLALPIRELAGRTLGLIGYGTLGQGVARVAPAFGMRVAVADRAGTAPRPGRMPLARLLAEADVVSLHCPLTPETRGLIGERELDLMRPDALLINTARGALVDGRALVRALDEHRLGGAGIDVLEREPPDAGEPLIARDIPRLIVTPHLAWAAREARQRCLDEIAANIEDYRRGGRRGRVD